LVGGKEKAGAKKRRGARNHVGGDKRRRGHGGGRFGHLFALGGRGHRGKKKPRGVTAQPVEITGCFSEQIGREGGEVRRCRLGGGRRKEEMEISVEKRVGIKSLMYEERRKHQALRSFIKGRVRDEVRAAGWGWGGVRNILQKNTIEKKAGCRNRRMESRAGGETTIFLGPAKGKRGQCENSKEIPGKEKW